MRRMKLTAAALLALTAPVWAAQYAVPDNGISANDCVTGYTCIDSSTQQTFSIGALSFPPPYLAAALPADLASHGIIAVVQTARPTGNFASIASSIQIVSGIPTQVWATTPTPDPTPQQIAQAAIAAGLSVTCASGATVCTSAQAGTYSLSATAQANLSGVMVGVGAGQGLPGGGSTFLYLDSVNTPHSFSAPQIAELYSAGRNFVYALDLFAAGVGAQPSGAVTLP
jgi:hypothetical protein